MTTEGLPLVVDGFSGAGKSTLLANFVKVGRRCERRVDVGRTCTQD